MNLSFTHQVNVCLELGSLVISSSFLKFTIVTNSVIKTSIYITFCFCKMISLGYILMKKIRLEGMNTIVIFGTD